MELLSLKEIVEETNHKKLCPLSAALAEKKYDLASLHIRMRIDLNTPDAFGWTPMYYAIKYQSPIYIIEEMVSAGALLQANSKTDKYNNLLMELSILVNNVQLTKWLLENSFTANFLTSFDLSPLNLCIKRSCSYELMMILISHGAVESGVGESDPPAIEYALHTDTSSLRNLIKAGVNVNAYYYSRMYPLLTRTLRITALHDAVAGRLMKAVKLLVENGANVNATVNDIHLTPLHLLVLNPRRLEVKQRTIKDIAVLLLNNGADANASSRSHGTPIDVTLQAKNWTILEALIRNGVDVNKPMQSSNNMNIFHFVIINKQRELVKLCIDFGADCAQSVQGKLPIYFAMETKDSRIIEILLKHTYCLFKEDTLTFVKSYGISPNLKYMDFYYSVKTNNAAKVRNALGKGMSPGRCPIHYASARRNPDVVRALLEYGASPNSLDQKGYCPLHIAVKKGAIESCLILLRYGSCFNYQTPEGHSPQALAEGSKNKEVIKVFQEISDNFSMVRGGNLDILNVLKKLLDKTSKNRFFCFINCINKKGNTIMAEAFSHGFDEIGKEIMILRLKAAN